MSAEDTIPFFRNGMDLGWSGFTPVGYPKVVPLALADYVEKNNLQGKMRFNLLSAPPSAPKSRTAGRACR